MLTDEAMLKIDIPYEMPIEPNSLQITERITILTKLNLSDTIQRSFFLFGFPNFSFELFRFCDSRTCFFDIGANIGLISCAASRWVPHARIYAFEPVPKNYAMLRDNFSKNCPDAHAYEFALSDRGGSFDMVTTSHDSGAASLETKYRIDRVEELGIPCKLETLQVRVIPFDDFLVERSISFDGMQKAAFKIDVEGHEMPVISGMEHFLNGLGKTLDLLFVVEVHRQNSNDVTDFFTRHGFLCVWPDQQEIDIFLSKNGGAIDLIFRRSTSQCILGEQGRSLE